MMRRRFEEHGLGSRHRSLCLSIALAATIVALQQTGHAADQPYPSKVVRMIVPASAGGGPDLAARVLASILTDRLNQQFIVDNRGGAAGIIGTQLVAQATPDGHTLLVTFDSFAVNPLVLKKLPYDTAKDFAPVMQVSRNPLALYVQASLGARTVKEFVAFAKQNPAKVNMSSPGPASSNRLTFELFKDVSTIDVATIAYKGGGPARLAMIAGEAQVMFSSLSEIMLPHVKLGKLNILGVSTPTRLTSYPDLPAIAETYPGFEAQSWAAIFAPAGTPKRIISQLHSALRKVLGEPGMKERFAALDNAEIVASTPEELARRVQQDQSKWGALIRKRNIAFD